ncbi:hypothetical protein [Methylobacterium platani]|uniref:DUF4276 family protein n=2 Tax=Methylobacterium platani TaxID=427683 RepID=A0A179S2V7_9HYPH|nr:hypothetical protein [Methylobacterium platani]KMO19591.1 hypothetical protein SQ03_07550 [Methylobacterium platani JCM 14648]OAS20081.1 hypothetical protein A5481_23540 [Methylobacterium platani]
MRFLVIPEDFRNDQHLLAPILTALLASLGFARPKLKVCLDPLIGGIDEALKPERLDEVVERYRGMVDVFLLCVDRDANPHRRARLDAIEARFAPLVCFLACEAWEELETWALAGLDRPGPAPWAAIRAERDVKERHFAPLAAARRLSAEPGGGRRTLGIEAAKRVDRIRQRCPEDFDRLAGRLAALRLRDS